MLGTQMNPRISYSKPGSHHQNLPTNVKQITLNIGSPRVQQVNCLAELSISDWKRLAINILPSVVMLVFLRYQDTK